MSQVSASPCISNRMANLRGMETDSLNHCLYYSYMVLIPWAERSFHLWKPRDTPLLSLMQNFSFMFVSRGFLKFAWQMYRLPQCKAGESCYFLAGVSLCPAPVLRVKHKIKPWDSSQVVKDYIGLFSSPSIALSISRAHWELLLMETFKIKA